MIDTSLVPFFVNIWFQNCEIDGVEDQSPMKEEECIK